ncbi:hypothetical protein [Arthrobacter sp. UYCu712]|uniref:hypothetical protein n=1 Tax=Arthrobacter sp. UYCu712 TaxID=3156340 RepID=UPI0033925F65
MIDSEQYRVAILTQVSALITAPARHSGRGPRRAVCETAMVITPKPLPFSNRFRLG